MITSARLFAVALFLAEPTTLLSEPQDEKSTRWVQILSTQKERFHYFMNFNGVMVFRQYDAEPQDPYVDTIWYFDHPTILAELGLDAETKSSIQESFDDWHDELVVHLQKSIREATEGVSQKARQEELWLAYLETSRRFERRLDSVLTSEQSSRLRQVQLRFLINHNGFGQFLNQENVRLELGISVLPLNDFKPLQDKLARKLFVDAKQVVASAIDDWLVDLTGAQRQIFDTRWKSVFERDNALEQLIWQLDYRSFLQKEKTVGDPLDVWANWPAFGRDVDGNISVRSQEDRAAGPESLKLYAVQSFFMAPLFTKALEISEEQAELFDQLRTLVQDHRYMINGEIGEKYGIPGRMLGQPGNERMVYNLAGYPDLLKEFEDHMNEAADGLRERYMDVLLPHQKDLFQEAVREITIRVKGPFAEFEEGKLGDLLKLSSAQKKAIGNRASKIRDKLILESRRLQEETLQELIAHVPVGERQKLRARIGKPLVHGPANLFAFGAALMIFDD